MMPNLAPKIPKSKLKDSWFQLVSNPDDPHDKNICVQVIDGPFAHVIVQYKNFKTHPELNNDGSLDCDFEYDIIMAPHNIGEKDITDGEGEVFEKRLGEALIELLWETAENENRISNTKESTT